MPFCGSCGAQIGETATFCPSCGKPVAPATSAATGSAAAPARAPVIAGATGPVAADAGTRALAFLIDIVPAVFLGILRLLPLLGWLIGPLLGLAYWLLRDINGASPGKMALGLRVMSRSGGEATQQQRILRNADLAAPQLLALVPLLGWMIAGPVAFVIFVVEIAMLFAKGERIGDQFANTMVIKAK